MTRRTVWCLATATVLAAGIAMAPGTQAAGPVPKIAVEWVTVGEPGNRPDTQVMNDGTTRYGSVAHAYRIGKFQITNAQYAAFLNAKAKLDPYQLYLPLMDRSTLPQGSGI